MNSTYAYPVPPLQQTGFGAQHQPPIQDPVQPQEYESYQLMRFDGKNRFVEVLCDAFPIEKVALLFAEYNPQGNTGNKMTKRIKIYMDFEAFFALRRDFLDGKLNHLLFTPYDEVQGQALAKKAGAYSYKKGHQNQAPFIAYHLKGGTSPERAKRADGKAQARTFEIQPSTNAYLAFIAMSGPGKVSQTGLISPDGPSEETITIPMTESNFKAFLDLTKAHIDAFLSAQYVHQFKKKFPPRA